MSPIYPLLGLSVAKFRRIKNPTWEQRQAHGEAIEKAIRKKQENALLAYPEKVRKARTDCEWRSMYIEAMKEKHGKDWTYETD